MEKKSYKGLVWLVVILIVLVSALIVLVVYKGFFAEKIENNNVSTTTLNSMKENNSSSDLRQNELNELAQRLFKGISETMMGSIEYSFETTKKITFDTLKNEYKHELVWKNLYLNNKIKSIDGDGDGYFDGEVDYELIELKDFKNAVKNVFGEKRESEFKYLDEFYASYMGYKLDGDQYKGEIAAYDGPYEYTKYFLKSYENKEEYFYLFVSHVYIEQSCFDEENNTATCPIYYKDSSMKNKLFIGKNNELDNLDELEIYKFTFKFEDDNYIFESVEEA